MRSPLPFESPRSGAINNSNKDAQLRRPTASVAQYIYTATLTSSVCVPGTKRPLFPFHSSLYHYNHQNVVEDIG